MVRIAVVNDDTAFLSLMAEVLEENGWETFIVREGKHAYEMIKEHRPDLVILDIRMESPENGWHIIELLKLDRDTAALPMIVCSAAIDDLKAKEEWLKERGIATLPKPFDIDDLYRTVERMLSPAG
ncbi:MAG TPA: response regulator [Chloroflexota bacterium]